MAWARSDPGELQLFDEYMKEKRKHLLHESGMSEGGNMKLQGEIPVRLDGLMQNHFGLHWRRDYKLLRAFWRLFQVGRVNRTAVPRRVQSFHE